MPATEFTSEAGQHGIYCTSCEYVTTCETCIRVGRCHECRRDTDYFVLNLGDWREINAQLRHRDGYDLPEPPESDISNLLQGYSAEPRNGWTPRGTGPLFFGMEIEVTCYSRTAVKNAMQTVGDLCIFKHDGSVSGFEMVTEPMSYEFATTEFPWSVLEQLESDGCTIQPADNGLHIHVSRDGFNGAAHTYTWEKFMHKNRRHVNRIARRRNNNWCRWTDSSDANYFPDLMRRKQADAWNRLNDEYSYGLRYLDSGSDYYTRRRTIERMSERFQYVESPDRYSAINLNNEETLEVRCFASTLSPTAALAALGLLHASIAYTGTVRAHNVIRDRAWSWENFHAYVFQNRETYPALSSVIDSAPVPYSASASF